MLPNLCSITDFKKDGEIHGAGGWVGGGHIIITLILRSTLFFMNPAKAVIDSYVFKKSNKHECEC